MPLQNRVLPTGEIVALPARGTFTGNRGILHASDGELGQARWRHPHWIVCVLDLPGHPPRKVMSGRKWTELFFLDEAVALAAGHRPCAYCRRAAWNAYRAAWIASGQRGSKAQDIDRALHAARVTRQRRHITYHDDLARLPDGVFVLWQGVPSLILGSKLLPFAPDGYARALPRSASGEVTVLTPAPTVATLAAGYRPALHPTASPAAKS